MAMISHEASKSLQAFNRRIQFLCIHWNMIILLDRMDSNLSKFSVKGFSASISSREYSSKVAFPFSSGNILKFTTKNIIGDSFKIFRFLQMLAVCDQYVTRGRCMRWQKCSGGKSSSIPGYKALTLQILLTKYWLAVARIWSIAATTFVCYCKI